MKQISLVTLLLIMHSNALAFDIKFFWNEKFDGRQTILLFGQIGRFEKIPSFDETVPTSIVITSPGGFNTGEEDLVRSMESVARRVRNNGQKLRFIFRETCSSACTTIFAKANNLARYDLAEVVADKDLSLGFHGAYDLQGNLTTRGVREVFVKYSIVGISSEWLQSHLDYFTQSDPNDAKYISVQSDELKKAGFTTHVKFENIGENSNFVNFYFDKHALSASKIKN